MAEAGVDFSFCFRHIASFLDEAEDKLRMYVIEEAFGNLVEEIGGKRLMDIRARMPLCKGECEFVAILF